ncbi:hypothetical protein PPERSA_07734 [Pseudocohnilembus persalinus]|uniref:Uncharacterized protein n=1 Tax=Pseudocohnilembus persalinus TaxID=266149 RepID=A0A0V0R9N9_PSEPJ|nr:hypothetical protein PPERSA_07734 [Pseudocohnilembus persalinus]|eukprot:KRX11209.1 hypothetical protein PPERSA_07734 [Pseudocohnilembus persalinus]
MKFFLYFQSQVQKIKPEQGNKMGQEKDEIQQYKELKDEIKEFLVQMKGLSDEEFQIMNMGKKYKLTFQYKENDLLNDMDNDNIEDLNEYIIEEVTEIQEEEEDEDEEQSQNLEQEEEQDEKVDQVKFITEGKEREKYIERLELHFPDLSKKNINIIDQFIEDNEYQNQKLNALYRNFEKERKELKEKVEEQIMNLFNIRLENLEKNNIKVRSQQEQQRLKEEIEAQKKIFEIKQQKIEAQKEMEKEVEQIQKQRKNQEWEQYHGTIKKQAGAYKQEKILKIREKQEETIKRKVEIQQKKKEEVLKNAPKVQQRQIQSYIKIQENIDKMDLKTYQKQYDQERIKYAVQNYQHIPQVEADFKRVVQDTKAREIRKQTVLDKADKVDMQNYQGFTANQLMKDMRYRLSTALQEAGLNSAKYSNQVLNQLSKPSQNNIY